MDSKDVTQNKLMIGYDLCNDYSQISFFNHAQGEPKTISITAGQEKFQIPTLLLRNKELDKWYFGEEAVKRAAKKEGILITDILKKCSEAEPVVIEEEQFSPSFLLELFIRRTLGFLTYEGIPQKVPDCIVFTVEMVDENLVKAIKESASAIGVRAEDVYVQDHEESFASYTIHQKSELWNYNVILLEYIKDNLEAFNLKINTKTTPTTATISRENFGRIESELDDQEKDGYVKGLLKQYFGGNQVSCVFLCGEGFEGEWAKETLRFLCLGRRVFQGKNLYTKGACYRAAAKIMAAREEYVFLGDNKLKYNIGLDVFYRGEKQYYPLISADENWYDSTKRCELLLEDEECIELKLTPIDHNDTRTVIVNLHDLPKRPNKTVRLLLKIKFKSANAGVITVSDLGFGEFYESSGKVWKHKIFL
ncbi:DUF5716 family protein [Konateibacter massiliensis]|uniref:DUF5716 family protein n=1 Tax=Konateibacter massiliensis TaxID=2002841 RepID=UPI000C15DC05|nr:DUF5716 family protein [Konateibacter massiliensis]